MNPGSIAAVAAISTLAFFLPVHAQHAMEPAVHPEPHAENGVATSFPYEGVVRKIDRKHHKLTIKQGPNVDLGMSGMTMEYLASDSKLLGGLKCGDKVKFNAEHVHGAFVLTGISRVAAATGETRCNGFPKTGSSS